MGVIDIDARLLRLSAEAALHAAEQTRLHTESEYTGDTPIVMETVAGQGPYAWQISPSVDPDGSVKLPIQTTRDEVDRVYQQNWRAINLLRCEPVTEIHGAWYTFQENICTVRLLANGAVVIGETAVLITTANPGAKGVNGELCWARMPREMLGRAPKAAEASTDTLTLRRQMFVLHDRYLEALRTANVENILGVMNDGLQSSVRNYVNDTGALILLETMEAHRAHLRSFFDKYEPLSVDLIHRVAQEWYLFAELRLTVRARHSAGGTLAFHIAEMLIPAHDGRFIAWIGHGTDPA
jgi:hypothetical protein